MSILTAEAENCFLINDYHRIASTTKVVEFQSKISGRAVYLRLGQGFPSHADVVVHPEVEKEKLLKISGVEANLRVEFRHGDHMKKFPTKVNNGNEPIHYGHALQVISAFALEKLCQAYHHL
jgi:hypothetical protein